MVKQNWGGGITETYVATVLVSFTESDYSRDLRFVDLCE